MEVQLVLNDILEVEEWITTNIVGSMNESGLSFEQMAFVLDTLLVEIEKVKKQLIE